MMNVETKKDLYVIAVGDRWVALDWKSGGYPHYVECISRAHQFSTPKEVTDYILMFQESAYGSGEVWRPYLLNFYVGQISEFSHTYDTHIREESPDVF